MFKSIVFKFYNSLEYKKTEIYVLYYDKWNAWVLNEEISTRKYQCKNYKIKIYFFYNRHKFCHLIFFFFVVSKYNITSDRPFGILSFKLFIYRSLRITYNVCNDKEDHSLRYVYTALHVCPLPHRSDNLYLALIPIFFVCAKDINK